ncbi:MAG: oxidoreductase [Planctomycetes bacterium RBG_13_62_9]|nr:MAG: oxidoreductase [Planctomycetes bacterium RBG_13_62_9]
MGRMQVRTTWDYDVILGENVISELKASFRGELIRPEDEAYESVRRVYNGMIDKHPRLIARCADVADVMTVVNFARQNDLLLAVRGGGHNGAGLGTCDGGIVLDLSLMKGIRVDPQSHLLRADGGCTQGEVNHAGSAFGLTVPVGIVSTTGIGGLTLGGGHGFLTRKYGLAIDNLLEADVVLADGHLVTASARQNEDLFWALRGGGGNFGVVTSFLFQAQPVSTVIAGIMLWDFERTSEMMKWYREFSRAASEDVYGFFAIMNVPPAPLFPNHLHGKTVCGVVWCHLGSPEQAERDLDEVRESHPPLFEQIGPMPITALLGIFDALLPPGLQWYWKGDFFNELSDGAIKQHVKFGSQLPTALSTMHLYPVDSQANRVGPQETAFNYRDAKWSMVIAGIDPDPANNEEMTEWAKEYWSALHPYSAGGAYVNFMMEEGVDRVRATYRGNYERLAAIKAQYDPGNLFRVNQNIRPQG